MAPHNRTPSPSRYLQVPPIDITSPSAKHLSKPGEQRKRPRRWDVISFNQAVIIVLRRMNIEQAARERLLEYQKHCETDTSHLAVPRPHTVVTLHNSAELTSNHLEQCFNLIKTTSGADYKSSSIGWHPREKKKEMKDGQMYYLLVQAESAVDASLPLKNPSIVGFLSFMITNDDPPFEDRLVVYIYEIHLDEGLRGSGLGTELMSIVREITKYCGVSKMMLTVFSKNTKARAFYHRFGFVKDQCSPEDREVRGRKIEADYVILSRVIKSK